MSRNFDLLTNFEEEVGPFEKVQAPTATVAPGPAPQGRHHRQNRPVAACSIEPNRLRTGVDAVSEEVAKLAQRIFVRSRQDLTGQAVVLCGIERGDGASWMCTQVASTIAAQGAGRICAVDANLRNPALHRYFGIANQPGLGDAVRRPEPIRDFLEPGPLENLWVLPAGVGDNSGVVFGSERFRERVMELRKEFDYLIFDAPPAGHSDDAAMLGALVDGVVLVVGAHSTRRETVREAKQHLEAAHVNLIGAVLNRRTFPIPEGLYKRL